MAEEAEASWDNTLEEWLMSEGFCCAAGLAQLEDGAFYAAAPVADEAGWGIIYAEDHEKDITQDDMSTKKVTITESATIKECAQGGKHKLGLWIAGEKWNITKQEKMELGDEEVNVTMAQGLVSKKKGVFIVCCKTQFVLAMYDEEKDQTAGNCKKAVLAFAEYLLQEGY